MRSRAQREPSARDRAARAFDAAMQAAGPFERRPLLALAVSGGSDSMALALLAQRWCRRRRGTAVALIVDHGLRPDAAAEARAVRRRLAAMGMAAHILHWRGAKPVSGVQAAARAARYALLARWCRRHGVLHLLTAHQADDQAETVAMRQAHGSGEAGLAAMPLAVALDGVRLVRPLLAVGRQTLRTALAESNVDWVEDPSNANPHFERIRIRAALAAADARRSRDLQRLARRAGAERVRRDDRVADLLAQAQPKPEGWLLLPRRLFADAPRPVARAALQRCLLCIGGGHHPPRGDSIDLLLQALADPGPFRGRTLAGCRIVSWRGSLVICREPAAEPLGVPAKPGPGLAAGTGGRVRLLGRLGSVPASLVAARRASGLPQPVWAAMQVLCDRRGKPLAVPGLGWGQGSEKRIATGWRPRQPLIPARFLPAADSCFNGIADYLE